MEAIPGPAGWPLIGNLGVIDLNNTVQSFMALAEQYGPIFKLHLGGIDRIFISNHVFVKEVCTRKEFTKHIMGSIGALAQVLPDGLFTAHTIQKTWGQVRRTLNPVFTPTNIRNMFPEMLDITSQLALKWARHGPRTPIDISADFTRLTLDTLALTAMDTRFNSFYHDDMHPFVQRFGAMFAELQRRSNRPAVLAERRTRESEEGENGDLAHRKDVFTAMLHRRDPVTGEQLADSVIIDNMITFFAGHDTTAGLLSFLVFHLTRNRPAYEKLQAEIDRVLAGGAMTPHHLDQLPYTKACLRETLRLEPPAQAFALTSQADNGDTPLLLDGRYPIRHGQSAIVLTPSLHRDRAVFGEDAASFRPERMTEEEMQQLLWKAFKPFGNGVRGCIGSEFAMQEAMVATVVLFQKFDFELVDEEYELQYQPSLNRRPKDLMVYARLRKGLSVLSLQRDLFVPADKGGE